MSRRRLYSRRRRQLTSAMSRMPVRARLWIFSSFTLACLWVCVWECVCVCLNINLHVCRYILQKRLTGIAEDETVVARQSEWNLNLGGEQITVYKISVTMLWRRRQAIDDQVLSWADLWPADFDKCRFKKDSGTEPEPYRSELAKDCTSNPRYEGQEETSRRVRDNHGVFQSGVSSFIWSCGWSCYLLALVC